MSPHTCRAAALGLGLVACSSRPLDTATDADASSSSSSSSSSSASAATMDATSGGPASTGDTDGSTSGTSTSDSTSGTSTTSTTTTGGGPPATCGPPCDETWEIDGDLEIAAWGDPPLVFDCLTAVHGRVRIQEDVPEDILDSLANLRRVDEGLTLDGHAQLTDLGFLGCLEEVGWLDLAFMPKLTDLSALSNLRVGQSIHLRGLGITALPSFAPDFAGITQLSLYDNPALVDLGAASTWGPFGDYLQLNFHNNAALTSLAGLGGLLGALVGDVGLYIQITDHPALSSLTGLEAIGELDDLWLSGLPQLTDLTPLAGLTDAGSIVLNDMPKLASLSGLGSLTTVSNFTIGDCVNQDLGGLDAITSLAGLDALTSVSTFGIANNDSLVSLAGAPKLDTVWIVTAVDNPGLSQAAYAAFLVQLDVPPTDDCIGPWPECQCFQIMPW